MGLLATQPTAPRFELAAGDLQGLEHFEGLLEEVLRTGGLQAVRALADRLRQSESYRDETQIQTEGLATINGVQTVLSDRSSHVLNRLSIMGFELALEGMMAANFSISGMSLQDYIEAVNLQAREAERIADQNNLTGERREVFVEAARTRADLTNEAVVESLTTRGTPQGLDTRLPGLVRPSCREAVESVGADESLIPQCELDLNTLQAPRMRVAEVAPPRPIYGTPTFDMTAFS